MGDYGNRAIRWVQSGTTSFLTAAQNGDAGEIVGGVVRVLVGSLGPGGEGEVCYRVRVR